MMVGPVETERRPPIVNHEQDFLSWPNHRIDEASQMIAMRGEAVGVGSHVRQLARIAHADQIRRDQAAFSFKLGNDVAPEIRRRRIAVQKQDRRTCTPLVIRHAAPEHVGAFFRKRLLGHGDPLCQKLIHQRLILIIDPAFVELVIKDRINQQARNLGALAVAAELLSRQHCRS